MKVPFIFLIIIFASISSPAYSQVTKDELPPPPPPPDSIKKVTKTVPAKNSPDSIWVKVETPAEFPGGDKAWIKFLVSNLNAGVPIDHKAPAGKYTVWIQFVVDKEGNASDWMALTSNGYGMEEEAVRVLKKAPKWLPGMMNGQPVKSFRRQPITFIITEDR